MLSRGNLGQPVLCFVVLHRSPYLSRAQLPHLSDGNIKNSFLAPWQASKSCRRGYDLKTAGARQGCMGSNVRVSE